MRQWLPDEQVLDAGELYAQVRWADADGPARLALDMVMGVDGGVTIGGTSTKVGGDADWAAFKALRDAADVILVGAGTARTEGYGPPQHTEEVRARRLAGGQHEYARLALVTRSADLDPRAKMFSDDTRLPLVVTCEAAPDDRLARLEALGVEVLRLGIAEVDLGAALATFGTRGLPQVLCEGGPSLNRALFTRGLVDELFVTVAPVVTGAAVHLIAGELPEAVPLELRGAVHADGELLLRYVVATDR